MATIYPWSDTHISLQVLLQALTAKSYRKENMSFPSDDNCVKATICDLKDVLGRAQLDSLEIGESLKQLELIVGNIESKAKSSGFVPPAFISSPAIV
jgi:hypothetical protein